MTLYLNLFHSRTIPRPADCISILSLWCPEGFADAENRLYPKLALVLDAGKRPIRKTVVDMKDLSEKQRKECHIKQVIPDGSYGISLEQFTATSAMAPV